MVRVFSNLGALLASIVLISPIAKAQSLVLTAPLEAIEVAEGDDFASDVLKNPWDFEQRRDIGWEENYDPRGIVVSQGRWIGSNLTPGGHVFPLFPGFKGSLFADPLPNDKTLPRLGINHRINTSKYYYLSYSLLHSDRSSFAVYWENDASKPEYWPSPESPRRASYDGFFHWNTPYRNASYSVYSFDLREDQKIEQSKGEWSGNVFALRIDPSVFGRAGSTTIFDWLRLVDPESAPSMTVTWDSNNIGPFHVVTVWLDSNGGGFDGIPLARFTNGENPGSYTFPSAMLPPGSHRFYVTAQQASAGSFSGSVTRSNYSASLKINQKPQAVFTSPSRASGHDFARDEIGNPWDMRDTSDVPNLDTASWTDDWRQFSEARFLTSTDAEKGGRVFQANADAPLPGRTESDVQVHMNVPLNTPINTNRYRYLTYRMRVDPRQFPSIHDKVERGWVSRPVFWNRDIINDAGSSKAHVVYEGWQTYTIDLWKTSIIERGIPWRGFPTVQHFRIDPLEVDVSTRFDIDWVTLTEEPRSENDRFLIEWEIEDSDDDSFRVDLYYDTNKFGFNGTRIKSFRLPAGSHSYSWNTSSLDPSKQYFLYSVVTDSLSTSRNYSSVPLQAGPPPLPVPRQSSAPMDFDGDGISDPTVYRQNSGQYFNRLSASTAVAFPWGGPQFSPFVGDFDGDGRADRGLRATFGGYLYWYANRSSDGVVYHPSPWGFPGDISVIADYNGNGRDELGVYRNGAWFLLDELSASQVYYWGAAADVPVPADYDGDSKADVAVWRPSEGTWWIINSGFSAGLSDESVTSIQWGVPGDIPVPADWTGDGRIDPAVFRPSLGIWFILDGVSGEQSWIAWGLPGDLPLVGDFDGDGTLDLTVWREATGSWYSNHRDGRVSIHQFGLPGDRVPARVSTLN